MARIKELRNKITDLNRTAVYQKLRAMLIISNRANIRLEAGDVYSIQIRETGVADHLFFIPRADIARIIEPNKAQVIIPNSLWFADVDNLISSITNLLRNQKIDSLLN